MRRHGEAAATRAAAGYENRIFTRLVLLVTAPLLILGALTGIYSLRLQSSRSDLMLRSVQENAETQIDGILTNLRTYYLSAVERTEYDWLYQQTEPPYSEYSRLSSVQETLRGGNMLSSYVSGYSYIDMRNGWVLSNLGMYKVAAVKNFEQLSAFIAQMNERGDSLAWVNNTAEPAPDLGSHTVDLSGYLLVLRGATPSGATTSLLIVRLNLTPLLTAASGWESLRYQVALVESATGQPILSTDGAFSQALREEKLMVGTYSWQKWRLCAGASTVNGVRCYAAVDESDVWSTAGPILLIAGLMTVGIALALVLCRWSSAALYRPVQELMTAVGELFGQRGKNQDEFDYIATGAAQMAQDQKELRYMAAMQRQKLCEQFMLHMLRSEVSQVEIERSMRELAIRQFSYYQLLALRVSSDPDASATERETMSIAVAQQLPHEVTEKLFIRPLAAGAVTVMVVGADSEAQLAENVQAVYGLTQRTVQAIFGRRCTAGASLPFTEPAHLNVAYFEALEARRGRSAESGGGLSYYAAPDLDRSSGGYDMALQNEITDAVYNCNRKQAERLIALFVTRMKENGARSYERQFYQQRLTSAILSVAENAGLSVSRILSEQEKGLFEQIGKIYDTERMQAFLFHDVAVPVMELLTDYRQNTSSSDLAKKVIALIRETGGDITLNECAERLNYHPSYIWKVLKSEKDTNFTDLVNAQKIEMAKELLMTTELTVAQIAETLHYSNVQNFIRFFSRETGMTPGKYRKEHRAAGGGKTAPRP